MRIPERVVRAYQTEKTYKEHPWPSYVYGKSFFEGLGAQFRTIDNREEMLLRDVVYVVDDYRPCSIHKQRSVGMRAVEELRRLPELADVINDYEHEDIWNGPVIHLVTALGMCLIHRQQIEHYIAQCCLLGVSKR
jgi:hypothetical protein